MPRPLEVCDECDELVTLTISLLLGLFSSKGSDVSRGSGDFVYPTFPMIRFVAFSILLLPAFKPRQNDVMGFGIRWIRSFSPVRRDASTMSPYGRCTFNSRMSFEFTCGGDRNGH